jgi:hypothetical protein
MSVAPLAVFPMDCFWICASARHIVIYKHAQGDQGARRIFRAGCLDDGWIRNVVGEENSLGGVPKCGTRGAASQEGNAYE